jgi:GNAT superfamily N-acetyltransferase
MTYYCKMDNLKFEDLEWDSEKLGVRCGRIICNDISAESDSAKLLDAFKRLISEKRGVDFITIKLLPAFRHVMNGLVRSCAELIDTEIVFKLNKTGNPNVDCEVNIVKECDPSSFIPLADEMVYSRFFLDQEIPKIKARELWVDSVKNYCLGRADKLAIAYINKSPVGMVTIDFLDNNRINLHIVGVLKKFQGSGVGGSMITKIANRYGDEYDIFVEASSMNTQAINLYQKSGFFLDSMHYILHVWADKHEGKVAN